MADLIGVAEYEMAGGTGSDAIAPLAISAASDIVRGYLGLTVDFVEDDQVTIVGSGRPVLILPELPIVSINLVTVGSDLTPLGVSEYSHNDGMLWRFMPGGATLADWPDGVNVFVNYNHGWAAGEIPADILLVTARIAVAWANAAGVEPGLRSEAIQDYTYTVAATADLFAGELSSIKHRRVTPLLV